MSPGSTITVLAILLIVVTLVAFSAAALFLLRQRLKYRQQELPIFEKRLSTASTTSQHRAVVRPSVYLYHDKEKLSPEAVLPSISSNSIPEIRITFPEEFDSMGKRHSGRVVVVRVGDTSIGLEPVSGGQGAVNGDGQAAQNVELDQVGGLVEKEKT
ncbi:hypothetical protein K470DRAFT_221194 [Piedraia hortae CBS 480.64]|uniref:Uncharacterized protein n=1 Tax=Piedraia hortae CBS 480.64 TaxID=1314780 RepID=A0A6A7BUR7_9PEZI|nr:hypothetical protein K470DRAFT_221194 [Piedraia hortae CBS 480.64]